MTRATLTPRRNLGAVILSAGGGFALLATLSNAVLRSLPDGPTVLFVPTSGVLLASFALVPVAILVSFSYFGTGGRGAYALGGDGRRPRMLFFLTGLAVLLAHYSFVGPALVPVGQGTTDAPEVIAIFVLEALATLAAILLSIVVYRAGVVQGLARWAMPLAILLTAVSAVFSNLIQSDWWDVPHCLGILLLGVAYWRAGVHTPPSVPEGSESLAE